MRCPARARRRYSRRAANLVPDIAATSVRIRRSLTLRSGGEVEFAMREDYSGPLAGLIGKSIPDLQPAFEQFAADLRKSAEAGR